MGLWGCPMSPLTPLRVALKVAGPFTGPGEIRNQDMGLGFLSSVAPAQQGSLSVPLWSELGCRSQGSHQTPSCGDWGGGGSSSAVDETRQDKAPGDLSALCPKSTRPTVPGFCPLAQACPGVSAHLPWQPRVNEAHWGN